MIEKRPFGRTGHLSTVTRFGAEALNRAMQAKGDRVPGILLEYGSNHIDTVARYGDAGLRIGLQCMMPPFGLDAASIRQSQARERSAAPGWLGRLDNPMKV